MTKEKFISLVEEYKTRYMFIVPLSRMVTVRSLGNEYLVFVGNNGKFSMKMKYDCLGEITGRDIGNTKYKKYYKMKHQRYLECYLNL